MKSSKFVHAGAAAWLIGVSAYALLFPDSYEASMQEDRPVEWATVWLFLVAGGIGLHRAVARRHVFDGLVGLFCLFVAGEEFSWGQRLIGYHPPEFFLEHNFQQEANLHNLPQSFLQPKWILMMALAGYGILLPVLSLHARSRRFLDGVGATPPRIEWLPWFGAAVGLLLWYPLRFTGEWIEAFAGGLFALSASMPMTRLAVAVVASIPLALVMTSVSGQIQQGRDAQRSACARQEIDAIVRDIVSGSAGTEDLWRMRRVHKRLWSSVSEEYVHADHLQTFTAVSCTGNTSDDVKLRRKYGIDPWGSPYWLEVTRGDSDQRQVTVYSFGPNRRRDSPEAVGRFGSDDIRSAGLRAASN